MAKNRKILQLSVTTILIISAVILARHFTIVKAESAQSVSLIEVQEVQQELRELQIERERLEQDHQEMRKELSDLWYEVIEQDETQEVALLENIEKIRKLAGLTDVQGDGIVISLNDKKGYNPLADPVESIIHDQNVIYLIDLLTDNGAQAISINDLRIVNSSYIFCIGTTILCNEQRMSPPYIIKAIGSSDQMMSALYGDPLYKKLQMEPYSVRFSFEHVPSLTIKGYETPARIDKDIEFLNLATDPGSLDEME